MKIIYKVTFTRLINFDCSVEEKPPEYYQRIDGAVRAYERCLDRFIYIGPFSATPAYNEEKANLEGIQRRFMAGDLRKRAFLWGPYEIILQKIGPR